MARRMLVVAVLVLGLVVPTTASAAAPENDNFNDARTLVPGIPSTGSTVGATLEPGEPWHSDSGSGPDGSVWFRWTANAAGTVRIDACDADFSTEVAVYGGSTLDSTLFSTRMAGALGGCGSNPFLGSYVVFRAAAGHEYRIVLAGWGAGDEGNYSLVLTPDGATPAPPANDEVAGAMVITGASPDAEGTNVNATSGFNEWFATGTQNVWWSWTSPVDGQATVDLCGSTFDTRVAVMRETDFGLEGVESDDDGCGLQSTLVFNAIKGTRYLIGAGGNRGSTGTIALRVRAGDDTTAPTSHFTKAPPAVDGHRNAAFEWESGESPVTYECSLDGAAFGFCDNRLYELSEGDHVYRVRATDQYGNVEDPPLQHRWRVEQPTPPNDDFADALTLVNGQAVTVNNGHATAEDGEPGHDPFSGTSLAPHHSVWFAFTAVGSSAELDFCQIDWPANWALYTGSSLASLARVAGNYTDENCKDSLSVTAGTTYHLAIDGQSRSDDLGTGPVTVILGKNAVAAEAPPTAGPPPAPEVTTDGPAREPAGRPTVGVTVELGAKARLVARTLKAPGKVACTGDATCRVVVRLERRKRVLAKHRWTVPAGEARTYSMRVGWRTRRQLCASSGSRVQVIARGGGTRVKRHAPLVCR